MVFISPESSSAWGFMEFPTTGNSSTGCNWEIGPGILAFLRVGGGIYRSSAKFLGARRK